MQDYVSRVRNIVESHAVEWSLSPAEGRADMLRYVGDVAAQVYFELQAIALAEFEHQRERLAREHAWAIIDKAKGEKNA